MPFVLIKGTFKPHYNTLFADLRREPLRPARIAPRTSSVLVPRAFTTE
jgi:hypothetical protein